MSVKFTPNVGFEWIDENGDSFLVKYEFPDPGFKIEPQDNVIIHLWSNNHSESQIFPISFDGGDSCGFLLTASAIDSNEIPEEYRNQKHFRVAAWAIARYLVEKNKHNLEAVAAKDNRYEFSLKDCIDQDLSLFALYKPKAPERIAAKPAILTLKLLNLGLIPFVDSFSKKILRPEFSNESKTLNISTNIPQHAFQEFYNDLLTRYIPSVDDSAFKFYLYYQIIESMMEDVLIDSAQNVLQDLTGAQGNVVAIRNSLEKYQKISSESARIKKIFGVLTPSICSDLKNSCVAFLALVDPEFAIANHQTEEVAFFVYKVRNQLIHNFRRTGAGSSQLKQIIGDLEELVPRLIYAFGSSRQFAPAAA